MRRLRCFRAVLPLLVATSLTACGSTPPTPVQAVPPDATGATNDPATGAHDRMGRLWGDPLADQTPVAGPGDGARAPEVPASAGADPDATFVPGDPTLPGGGLVLAGGPGELIPFASTRLDGGGLGFDIFIYDRAAATVVAPSGINTPADEVNPYLTNDGRLLVYATDQTGDFDIQLFDLATQTINTLQTLNSPLRDDRQPSVSLDGQLIAYTSLETGYRQLRLHDVVTGQTVIPAPVAGFLADIHDPNLSADGRVVAFTSFGGLGGTDIFVYDIVSGALLEVPFVNSEFDEFDPWLSADGNFLLFASDRAGPSDIFLTDLRAGLTDRLALANGPFDERNPRFLGLGMEEILFQTDRTGPERLMIFHQATGLLDTLPIAHEIGEDDIIEDEVGPGGGFFSGGFGRIGGGGFGGVFGRPGLF